MGFYYFTIFSIVPLGIAYGVLALIYWGVVRALRGTPKRGIVLAAAGAVFLVLPISEELWIAWNFGQACKEAGMFIHKKVQVDGFYDETGGGSLELVRSGTYRYIESRSDKGATRLTSGDANLMKEALARFAQANDGKDPSKEDVVRVKLDDKTEALVFPKKGDSWRITYLDRPTARYHFRMTDPMNGTRWAHKVIRSGSVVIDIESNEEIARYTSFGRSSPWFFISLGIPAFACDAPGRWPLTRNSLLIYREVLIPVAQR